MTWVVLCNSTDISTSADGFSWTLRTGVMPFSSFADVAYNGTTWCAISNTTGAFASVTGSPTASWTKREANLGPTGWNAIAAGSGIFVVVTSGTVATSPDAITWTTRTMPSADNWSSVAWNGSVFVITPSVSNAGVFAYSSDGVTWSTATVGVHSWNVQSLAANSRGYFAAGMVTSVTGTASLWFSRDGANWRQSIATASSLQSVQNITALGTKFVFMTTGLAQPWYTWNGYGYFSSTFPGGGTVFQGGKSDGTIAIYPLLGTSNKWTRDGTTWFTSTIPGAHTYVAYANDAMAAPMTGVAPLRGLTVPVDPFVNAGTIALGTATLPISATFDDMLILVHSSSANLPGWIEKLADTTNNYRMAWRFVSGGEAPVTGGVGIGIVVGYRNVFYDGDPFESTGSGIVSATGGPSSVFVDMLVTASYTTISEQARVVIPSWVTVSGSSTSGFVQSSPNGVTYKRPWIQSTRAGSFRNTGSIPAGVRLTTVGADDFFVYPRRANDTEGILGHTNVTGTGGRLTAMACVVLRSADQTLRPFSEFTTMFADLGANVTSSFTYYIYDAPRTFIAQVYYFDNTGGTAQLVDSMGNNWNKLSAVGDNTTGIHTDTYWAWVTASQTGTTGGVVTATLSVIDANAGSRMLGLWNIGGALSGGITGTLLVASGGQQGASSLTSSITVTPSAPTSLIGGGACTSFAFAYDSAHTASFRFNSGTIFPRGYPYFFYSLLQGSAGDAFNSAYNLMYTQPYTSGTAVPLGAFLSGTNTGQFYSMGAFEQLPMTVFGGFCLVGTGATRLASSADDGVTWTARTHSLATDFVDVAWNGAYMFAISTGTTAAASVDGVGWMSRSLAGAGAAPTGGWLSVTTGSNRIFVAVGSSSIATSSDSSAWSWGKANPSPTGGWTDIVWNGATYVVVGSSSAATSPDLVTWTGRSMPAGNWKALAWNGTSFCAVASGTPQVAISPDGVAWTTGTIIPGVTQWQDICVSGTTFVAVAGMAAVSSAATSGDGLSWTPQALPTTANWTAVGFDGKNLAAVSVSGTQAASSPDGTSWTSRTIPASTSWNGMVGAVNVGFAPITVPPVIVGFPLSLLLLGFGR